MTACTRWPAVMIRGSLPVARVEGKCKRACPSDANLYDRVWPQRRIYARVFKALCPHICGDLATTLPPQANDVPGKPVELFGDRLQGRTRPLFFNCCRAPRECLMQGLALLASLRRSNACKRFSLHLGQTDVEITSQYKVVLCSMVGKDGINDPPLFAYDRDSATEVLSAAGSKTKTHKSAMEVSMPACACNQLCKCRP